MCKKLETFNTEGFFVRLKFLLFLKFGSIGSIRKAKEVGERKIIEH